LPADPRVNKLVVKPHPLDDYDQLQADSQTTPENDDDDDNDE